VGACGRHAKGEKRTHLGGLGLGLRLGLGSRLGLGLRRVRKEEITHLCGECAGPCPGHLGCEVEEGCYRLDASEGYKCAALTGVGTKLYYLCSPIHFVI